MASLVAKMQKIQKKRIWAEGTRKRRKTIFAQISITLRKFGGSFLKSHVPGFRK